MGGIDKWKKEDATGTPGQRRICLSDGGAMAQILGLPSAGFTACSLFEFLHQPAHILAQNPHGLNTFRISFHILLCESHAYVPVA